MENKEYKTIQSPAKLSMHSYVGDLQGCGHIRIIFPTLLLNHFRFKRYNFHFSYGSYFINDLNFYKNFTFIQFQRAATDKHLNLIKHYVENVRKNVKTPIIYEIDDLLIDIPHWNRAQEYYDKYKIYLEEIMRIVNGITVSTNKLKEIYSKYNNNITVIPNHLLKFLWGDVSFKGYNTYKSDKTFKRPRILYQGSSNHFCTEALYNKGIRGGDFGSELLKFIRKTVDEYQWVFMGGYPLELDDLKNTGKIEYHSWKNVFEYPTYIKSLNVDLCIAPLQYNLFNESKSNIKNLEYVALGVPAIYTDIEPYKHTAVKVKTDEEMISKIKEILNNYLDIAPVVWKEDYNKVKEQLFWEDDNNLYKYINSYLNLFGKKMED